MNKAWSFIKSVFKKNFIAGTLVLVPIFVTFWVLKVIVVWADNFVISFLPARFQPEVMYGRSIPGLGILVTILLIIFAGLFTRLYLGRKLVKLGDIIISKIPIGRSVYTIMKEFLYGIFNRDKERFKGVALIEWPRKGCHMFGFITGYRTSLLPGESSKKWVSMFVPTTPNPTSGFYVMLPEEDVKPMDITIDHAFKILITAGFITTNEGKVSVKK